jgi:predicted esterase
MPAEIITWKNTSLSKGLISTAAGAVPVIYWIPEQKTTSQVIVAFHYQEGSKNIWLEDTWDSLLLHAVENNIPFIACDMYGHGEWQVDGFDTSYIDDDAWDTFVEKTAVGVTQAITTLIQDTTLSFDSLQFIGSSLGCHTAMTVIRNNLRPVSLVLASPVPAKEYDDESSFHNNLSAFEKTKLLVISGRNDEDVAQGEVQWWYDQIDSETKKIIFYDSGHDLPADWISQAITFLT